MRRRDLLRFSGGESSELMGWDQMLAPLGLRAAAGSTLARPGGPGSSGLRKVQRPPSLTALCVPATASSGIR